MFKPWPTPFENEKHLVVDGIIQLDCKIYFVLCSDEKNYLIESKRKCPYRIMDESYAYIKDEIEEGYIARTKSSVAEDSAFLQLLCSNAIFNSEHQNNPFKHYLIRTSDEVINLVSDEEPLVSIFSDPTGEFLRNLILRNKF